VINEYGEVDGIRIGRGKLGGNMLQCHYVRLNPTLSNLDPNPDPCGGKPSTAEMY
jgi:hypothetical protein